eukprot:CAMPEP_0196577190 /NCGR_PEP_ID=MMETSP1081-20130531/6296_1 /TAXON_ID=36882 /ORGANISM="Pyramimonas amylifera, Strain CCMP720" /LENGTH=246 /DNA_ID=CAMNT_0041896041 /DNA_START=113 /DNA_END=853 /DNA_ORIENTATION=+
MTASLKASTLSLYKSHSPNRSPFSQKPSAGRRSLKVSALSVGDRIPASELAYFDSEGGKHTVNLAEICAGKKVVLFAVPGAFTPTCSLKHVPGFITNADAIKAKGVDTIACVSVNDPYVMDVWAKSVGSGNKVMMLADGGAVFTRALGVDMDKTNKGLGVRSRRYSMIVEDGEVKVLNLEDGGGLTSSGAEEILAALGSPLSKESFLSSTPEINVDNVQPFWGGPSTPVSSAQEGQIDVGNVKPFW